MADANTTPALVRTIVPMVVGAVSAWLLTALGLTLPMEPATEFLTLALSAVYYSVVRWLEARWPDFGLLLGSRKQPVYTDEHTDPDALEG